MPTRPTSAPPRRPPPCSLLALAACAAAPAPAPAVPADSTADPLAPALATIRGEDLAAHVRTLAADEFEGRFPGTPGEVKTVAYITAHLARLGIRPALGGSYLQPVPLVAGAVAPDATLRVRGRGGALELRWGDDHLLASPASAPLVELGERELVFAGYGIVAPEYGWDDYGELDVRGKIVLALADEPGDDPARFEGKAASYYGTPWHKGQVAAARGAAALLEIRRDEVGGVAWSTLALGARAPKIRLDHAPADRPALQGLLREARAAELLALAGARLDELRAAAARPGFRAVPLAASASIRLETRRDALTSHNVVGILPGARRPDEYVVYTAHWDHVGTRPGLRGDAIFNGAVDNATGTAALLELAEAFAALDPPPDRSIVFLATTAEEQGLLGARHYAEHPVFPLRATVGVINMDALFPFGATAGMTVVGLGSSELEDHLARAARAVGRTLHPDPAPELGAFFRSDHYPFAEKGVPAIFAVGGPTPAGGEAALRPYEDYVTTRYHQPGDEFDPATWDMAGIVQDVEVYLRTGAALAEDVGFPNWRPGHAFRARRDAMRPGA